MKRLDTYKFLNTDLYLPADLVANMVLEAKSVTFTYLFKLIPLDELKSLFPDYSWKTRGGKRLQHDCSSSFFRGKYRGKKCLFIVHQGVRYVFVKT